MALCRHRRLCRVVAVLACVALLACSRVELFGSLDEADANAILEVLDREGITAHKESGTEGTWRVSVAQQDQARALGVARARGLPRERFSNVGQLFKKQGLVSSPAEDRIRYIFALSQELSATLSQIDGVLAARVHPVIPMNDPLATSVRPSSAAVFIKHRRSADVNQMGPAIRNLVTRSIEGLSPDNVALTFVPAEAVPAASVEPRDTPALSPARALGLLLVGAAAPACLGLGVMFHRRRKSLSKSTTLQVSRVGSDNADLVVGAASRPVEPR